MTCYAHFITSFLNNVQTIMLTIIATIQVRQWVRYSNRVVDLINYMAGKD